MAWHLNHSIVPAHFGLAQDRRNGWKAGWHKESEEQRARDHGQTERKRHKREICTQTNNQIEEKIEKDRHTDRNNKLDERR